MKNPSENRNMYVHKKQMDIQELESKIIGMASFNSCLAISEKKKACSGR